ncbi:spore germination protein [Desulfosporosinus sp.]|uniref:spore germination protein n=1 Tax=Desulfosporosinus sp. TaxID=157907 RepID=UPI0023286EF3|nr:spore germination protein [Desulfosporosinus sp.]MCO5387497.1 spore germination protein [Desulfosporosinus sp.]MDA8221970.1 spore germination protein [Desulfitobacterium hafniense]
MIKRIKKRNLETTIKSKETNHSENSGLNKSLDDNISLFKNIFKNDETLIIREFQNKRLQSAQCCIIYLDGMVNAEIINENIIQPVLSNDLSEDIESGNLLEELKKKVIVSNNVTLETEVNKIVSSIINGDTLFLLEGYDKSLIISSKGGQTRPITEPTSSRIIRGPREGFTESIMLNLSLVRRKINNPEFKVKFKEIGERTHTKTCICYIEGLALEGILNELELRLDKIEIDGIIDSGYIQELIKDAPYSPFETIGSSERPDVIAAKLLEGRIALFVDGSPFVLTVPYLVVENFQSNEDYYNNYIFSTMNRLVRGFTAVTSITIPALFLSLVTYHQEMLPTSLLLSISSSREGVPFPTVVSLFIMLFIFDMLREAGTRMPSSVGQAVNIVGTLVLGQAAVEARLVSAPVIIVTALTGIMTLINMNFISATIIFRTFLLLGASFLGIYGFLMCIIILYLHLMSIRSFGVPYMMNVTRAKDHDGHDAWIRAPWWTMTLRPKIIAAKDLVRQSSRLSKEK